MTLIGQALGIKINYVSGSWSEILNLVKDKKIDGIRMIAKTKATEQYLSFSDSFGAIHFSLVTRNNVYISSLKQFANKPLGVITNSYPYHYFRSRYPGIELKEYNSLDDIYRALMNCNIDGVVLNIAVISHFINTRFITALKISAFLPEMESKVRIGIRDDWPELTAIINKAIHSISKDRINALKKKWISQKGYESIFTLDELHWLSSHRVIRFTGDCELSSDDYRSERKLFFIKPE